MKFYKCNTCGNIMELIEASGVPVICCGETMKELIPGTSDGAMEKHVPVVTVEGNRVFVEVGSVIHPMTEAHYIQWIAIETKKGCQRAMLDPTMEPKAEFILTEGDEVLAAYEYCNLHSLWKYTLE